MAERDDGFHGFLMFVVLGAVALFAFFAFCVGISHGKTLVQQDAIQAGVAEWVPSDTGSPEFSWVTENVGVSDALSK